MPKKVKFIAASSSSIGPITRESLAEAIRAKRTSSNLRLEDAAMLCGIAKETLSKIEKAKPGIRLESVLKICKSLGLELILKDRGAVLE